MSFHIVSIFTFLCGVDLRFLAGWRVDSKWGERGLEKIIFFEGVDKKGETDFFWGIEIPVLTTFIPLVGLIWINLV